MKTIQQAAPHAYMKSGVGQKQFSMYDFEQGPDPSPTVPFSPPPWDGSAEGYGPVQDDYQAYYNEVDPSNPPRWGARGMGGCVGCGMGAEGETDNKSTMLMLAGGALLLWLIMKAR